jgi:serine/threonine protein kinase/Tol biopolymer transport system component
MQVELPERVRLGAFELDLRAGEVRKGARKILLQEQPFQVLRMLVERRGEILTRDEIKKRLWPNDTVVEFEHSIQAAISRLRQALGDSADRPKYIETIPRRGYRLIVPVERVAAAEIRPAHVADEGAGGEGAAIPVELQPATLGGRTVSHYRVLDIIGGGGMGVVYRAEDLKLGRSVALKFLPEELGSDPQALERFSREARAASSLDHPNICSIYQFGEHEGRPFMVMPLLEGQTLRERLAADAGVQKGMPLGELLDIGIQVSEGLQAAHEKGIVHRDIKPANIFITSKGVVKILDFGLAKLLEASEKEEIVGKEQDQSARPASGGPDQVGLTLTRTGAAMGTAGYMSPEQVRGEKLDVRTDIFSLGLVLYEMATGQRAFTGETAPIVHDAILNNSPVPVRELNSSLPAKLVTTIDKALQKERAQRYQTAAELGSELQRVNRDAGGGLATVLRSGRRRRRALWLTASLLLVLVGLAAGPLMLRRMGPPPKLVERQVTANPFENWVSGGAISPDGRYVAYHDQTGVYVRTVESGETQPVTVPAELKKRMFSLYWVPGGDKLLTVAADPEGWNIWEIPVLGQSEPKLLFRNGWNPAVSPDGRTVAFTNSDYGRTDREIWIAGWGGNSPRRFAEAQPNEHLMYPLWSPDGRWLAYISEKQSLSRSESSTILAQPAVSGPARVLLADSDLPKQHRLSPSSNAGFAWCSDGRLVFPVADRTKEFSARTNFSLWHVRVDATTGHVIGKPSQLTEDSNFRLWNTTCAADGRRLSVIKNRTWNDIYVAQLYSDEFKPTSPRRLTLDNRGSSIGAWTPDSKAVLFQSERSGRSQVFRQRIDSDSAELVTSGAGDISEIATTPNGAGILYRESDSISGVGGKSSESFWLARKPEAGGPSEKLLKLTAKNSFQCATKPNSSPPCVLAETTETQTVFYALDPLRGKSIEIAEVAAIRESLSDGWSLSPEASHLAVLNPDKQGPAILIISVADGSFKTLRLDSSIGKPQSISWSADSMGFFLTCREPDSFNLVHITSFGKVRTLLRTDRKQFIINPLPSPDGKHLAFQGQSWDSNLWIIQ